MGGDPKFVGSQDVPDFPYAEYGKAGLATQHYVEGVRKEADTWYERVRHMGDVKVSGETMANFWERTNLTNLLGMVLFSARY